MKFIICQKQFQALSGNNCHYGCITSVQEKNEKEKRRFSWVYDCGHKDFNRQIPDNGKVDLIVLSHFDADHVGGAYDLIQRNKGAMCIAPYLDEDMRILILSENSESYIQSDIDIQFIERLFRQGADDNIIFIQDEEPDLKKIKDRVTTKLQSDFWTFYPLQYQDPSLKQYQYVCNGIKNQFGSLTNILKGLSNNRTAFSKQLYNEYKKLILQAFPKKKQISVTANSISVCLYSGPTDNFNYQSVGWLHTGDTNLKNKSWFNTFKSVFAKYKDNIGVISLPHHGAKSCHNSSLFQEWPFTVYVLTDHSAKKADFSIDPLFLLHNRYYTICEHINYDDQKERFCNDVECCRNERVFYPFFLYHRLARICGECKC